MPSSKMAAILSKGRWVRMIFHSSEFNYIGIVYFVCQVDFGWQRHNMRLFGVNIIFSLIKCWSQMNEIWLLETVT